MVHNHSLSHSMLQLLVLLHLNSNLSVLTVLDQTQPLASVLMVHNHNLSHSMLQLLVLLHLNSNLSVLTVLDQTQPPASVLMVHNHKQQHHSIFENRQKVKLMCSFSKKDEDRCILYKSTDHNKSYVPVIYFLT